MIIFVTGMARSASMWTYNISRELIRSSGKTPLPENMQNDEALRINQAFKTHLKDDEYYIIKTHNILEHGLPGVKIIFTYRDVRDAMLSYMRFMHCGFNQGIKAMIAHMETTDYYFENHNNNITRLRYDDIISTPTKVVTEIGDFINCSVSKEKAQVIANQYSKENVKEIINNFEKIAITPKSNINDLKKHFEVSRNIYGNLRLIDKKTRFQTNHITSKKEGEWRDIFSDEQKKEVMRLTRSWLLKYDFPI